MARDDTSTGGGVQVWDLPTRLFHWSLVALIVSAFVSFTFAEALGDNVLRWHRVNGYVVLILLVWRVLWGIAGSSTARFASFLGSPLVALSYLADLVRGRSRRFLGHNPAGAWMIVALLGLVCVQAGLGLFTVEHNDLTAGPLYRLVDESLLKPINRWHRWLFYWGLLPLVAMHVLANVLYGLVKREPLVRAMVTGRKPADDYEDGATMVAAPAWRAAGLLALAAALVLVPLWTFGGKL